MSKENFIKILEDTSKELVNSISDYGKYRFLKKKLEELKDIINKKI